MPKLDRTRNHDLRSFDFVLKGTETLPLEKHIWSPMLPVLDQGNLGACTGFSAAAVAASMSSMAATNRRRLCRNQTALALYILATNLDDTSGQYPIQDTGSDVNSALRGLRNLGWVGLYQWLTSARAVAGAVSHLGPVMMGSDWYNSMMSTQPQGTVARLVVDPSSGLAGGHAWSIIGVEPADEMFVVKNSWGRTWGANGYARITFDDLDVLIAAHGDAVLPQVSKQFDTESGLI